MFPQLSLTTLKNYIVFSAILFFSGFYYYFRIVHQLLNKPLDESANGEELDEANEKDKLLKDLVGIVRKHRLLFYILLNTCCAMVALMGKTLSGFFFGQLTNQEESFAKKYFRRYVQTKLTFPIFFTHHSLLKGLAIQIVCLLPLRLKKQKIALICAFILCSLFTNASAQDQPGGETTPLQTTTDVSNLKLSQQMEDLKQQIFNRIKETEDKMNLEHAQLKFELHNELSKTNAELGRAKTELYVWVSGYGLALSVFIVAIVAIGLSIYARLAPKQQPVEVRHLYMAPTAPMLPPAHAQLTATTTPPEAEGGADAKTGKTPNVTPPTQVTISTAGGTSSELTKSPKK